MKQLHAKDLLKKYQQGMCTKEELDILESWYNLSEYEPVTFDSTEILNVKERVWRELPIHHAKKK